MKENLEICNNIQKVSYIYIHLNETTMTTLTNTTKTEAAIQMVIMDAIEKGHTNTSELVEYMKSLVFENAVKNYLSLMK